MPVLVELFNTILEEVNMKQLLSETEALWKIESGQRSRDQRRSARRVESLLRKAGMKDVERIVFPADGKATYQDKTMPMAWDVTKARLTVIKSPQSFAEPVVADYARHPFHVIPGSTGAPKGGTIARLVTEEQMYAGCDVRGAMIITAPETRARGAIIRALCDFGAIGLVNDKITDRYVTPDSLPWVNACTEGPSWHIDAETRPFIGFTVSPRVGDQLRAVANAGEVLVRVESNARRYEGETDVVTAVLPGRDKREIWLLNHLYEPLANDNNSGAIAAIEIVRTLQRLVAAGRLPRPRFTLRLLYGLEQYGFAAYADRRGGCMKGKVLGALNMDGSHVRGKEINVTVAPAGSPFFGDYVIEELFAACKSVPSLAAGKLNEGGSYNDDKFLSDSTTLVPTVAPHGGGNLWHNSAQTMEYIEPDEFRIGVAFSGAWAAAMLTLEKEALKERIDGALIIALERMRADAAALLKDKSISQRDARMNLALRLRREEGRLENFTTIAQDDSARKAVAQFRKTAREIQSATLRKLKSRKVPDTKQPGDLWLRIAATIIPRRTTVGFPHDLSRVPKAERRSLPDGMIYGPFASVVSNMDGKKKLDEIFRETGWEQGKELTPGQMRQYLGAVEFLSEHGYLKTKYTRTVTRPDIVKALRKVGVATGDLVMLHSGLAVLGHVEGGPDTIIDACLEAVGPNGTLLAPAFTRSVISIAGSPITCKCYRPYNAKTSIRWVVPARFLQRPGARRSAHPTHSVVGIGPLTEACFADHAENDAPVSRKSPFGKLVDYNGKMVWLGADLASTTFLHLLEDEVGGSYLADALCQVVREDGRLETVHVPRYLPGDRDFYRTPAENSKAYRRLFADGLRMRRARLGFGEVKLISAPEFYEIGMAALTKDPNLTLCDRPECVFCRRHWKK